MRTVMLVLLAVALLFGAVGCLGLSVEDQAELNSLTAEEKEVLLALYKERAAMFKHVEDKTKEVTEKIIDKTLTLADGEQYLKLLEMQMSTTVRKVDSAISDAKAKYSAAKVDLQNKGYGGGDILIGLLYSAVGALTGMGGTRLSRGAHVNPPAV